MTVIIGLKLERVIDKLSAILKELEKINAKKDGG
jgi:hypothetical protein